jgi:putative membrane protein
MKTLFSETEKQQIQQAVSEAESKTSGEIVPYIVAQSSRHDDTLWRTASLAAVCSMALVVIVFQFYEGWGLGWLYTGWGTISVALIAGTLAALLTQYVPAVKRGLTPGSLLALRVHARAMRAFVEEEVFNTKDRTGILLFVSMLEHRIEVIGDRGINQKVTPDDWIAVVERIQCGIKQNDLAEGMIEAIQMCGKLLERKGVAIQTDDTNELPDSIRLRDE